MDSKIKMTTDVSGPETDAHFPYKPGTILRVEFYPEERSRNTDGPAPAHESEGEDDGEEEDPSDRDPDSDWVIVSPDGSARTLAAVERAAKAAEARAGRARRLGVPRHLQDQNSNSNWGVGGSSVAPRPMLIRRPLTVSMTVVRTLARTLSCVLLVSVKRSEVEKDARVRDAFEGVLGRRTTTAPAGGSASGSRRKRPNTKTKRTRNSKEKEKKQSDSDDIKVVLKIYDRRFARGIREDYAAGVWDPTVEADWRRFEAMGEDERPEVFLGDEGEGKEDSWLYESSSSDSESQEEGEEEEDGRSVPGRWRVPRNLKPKKISPSKWTPGQREAYMQKICDRVFRTEVSIYRHLAPLQGKKVPWLYGSVRMPFAMGGALNGIMMEYVHPSFSLRDIPENIPESKMWQEVGETAIKVVQDVGDFGVLNRDVRLDNVLVVPVKEGYHEEPEGQRDDDGEDSEDIVDEDFPRQPKLKYFKAVMIDFGLARLQREDESDEDWRKARNYQDEEGAVGAVLEMHLGKARDERPFKFKPSLRLYRPGDIDEADI